MEPNKNLKQLLSEIDSKVVVCAATKYVDGKDSLKLLSYGINNFAENRVDAFLKKHEALKDYDIKWHFIGHLQSNKAKLVANKIDYLHSLDSLKLARIINENRDTPLDCFVEVSINGEESKDGIKPEDALEFVKEAMKFKNIHIVGLMMMSVKYSDHESLMSQFTKLVNLKKEIENEFSIKIPYLSMGMSNDYKEAIEAGATHVRLGRILFDGFSL
ncbi:MAG: YggS family pyridoxal phosphate-dependent enzyme [Bacilli bacterium]|nr:YggS family pyridoxal phosphate-dependent enzyme [Bacilli bacterium]